MRLIDIDALIEKHCDGCSEDVKAVCKTDPVCATLMWFQEAPIIDAVPVRHGLWISLTECANAGVYCSVCNKKVYKEDYAWSNKRIKMRSNYCPNCGARMDGE